MLLRVTLSVSVLVVAYSLIPTKSSGEGSDVPWLILELCVFGAVVGIQLPAIIKSKHPVLRAAEALAILVPLYLLIFFGTRDRQHIGDDEGTVSAGVKPGTTVAVVGDGAVGLCGVLAASKLGAERVIAMSRPSRVSSSPRSSAPPTSCPSAVTRASPASRN